jgi:PPOX class probable F420-dependent enzyme
MDDLALARLDREPYISLATFRRDGRAVETPVWFAAHAGKLYVFSEAKAGKVKRLRNSSRIRVAPCSFRGAVHGPWVEGNGHLLDDRARIDAAYAALHGKYGWKMWLADTMSTLSGRIKGRAMLELEV